MSWSLERVPGGPFGESIDGPAWDGAGLLFCDVRGSRILRYDPVVDDVVPFRAFTVRTRGLAFGPGGRLYGAQGRARRIVWYRDDGSTYYLEAMLDGQRHDDPQDLVVDARGRIWFTDLWTDESSGGPIGFPPLDHRSVLRLDRTDDGDPATTGSWVVRRLTFDTVGPHGLAFSTDRRTLYVSDGGPPAETPSVLRAYPIRDDGSLGPGRVLHAFDGDRSAAGMCLAADGSLIVAVGAAPDGAPATIGVFSPDGDLIEATPVRLGAPTNCAFGGDDMATLFVTTDVGELLQVRDSGRSGAPLPQHDQEAATDG